MRKPYGNGFSLSGIDADKFHGVIFTDKEQLVEHIKKAYEANLQVTAHCVGYGALDMFLSAYEEVNRTMPIQGKRFSITHADFTDRDVLKKIKSLGLMLISQPVWHYRDAATFAGKLDEETMRAFLPYKDIEDLGVVASGGSDQIIMHETFPHNPFQGLYNLVTRKTYKGVTVNPEQRVSRQSALKMYTLNGAVASFDEKVKGTLEIGKFADMAVLSRDYFTCGEEEIQDIESELTIVGGKVVYSKNNQNQGG